MSHLGTAIVQMSLNTLTHLSISGTIWHCLCFIKMVSRESGTVLYTLCCILFFSTQQHFWNQATLIEIALIRLFSLLFALLSFWHISLLTYLPIGGHLNRKHLFAIIFYMLKWTYLYRPLEVYVWLRWTYLYRPLEVYVRFFSFFR